MLFSPIYGMTRK